MLLNVPEKKIHKRQYQLPFHQLCLSSFPFTAGTDIQAYTSLGPETSGFITDLTLALTDPLTCDNEMFTLSCAPVYYVCVKAMNKAGLMSAEICSSPIRVVEQDRPGKMLHLIKFCFAFCQDFNWEKALNICYEAHCLIKRVSDISDSDTFHDL